MTKLFSTKRYFMSLGMFFFALLFLGGTYAYGNGEDEGGGNGSLTIYSPQDETDVSYILEAAEKQFDFPINILRVGGGSITDRLIAEKENPQVDLIFGVTQLLMEQLKGEDLFEKYRPEWADDIPKAYQDKDGYYYGFWQTPIVMAYLPKFVSDAEAPKSWLDLTKPQYRDRFVVGATTSQTTRVYLSGMLAQFLGADGDVTAEGWNFMRDLFANSRPFPGDYTTVFDQWASGDLVVALHWLGGAIKDAKSRNAGVVKFVNPAIGTPVVSESIALIKGNTNPNAKAFIDWFGSKEFQIELAQDLGKAPVREDALAEAPQSTKDVMQQFTAQEMDWSAIGKHVGDWMSKIELEYRQ